MVIYFSPRGDVGDSQGLPTFLLTNMNENNLDTKVVRGKRLYRMWFGDSPAWFSKTSIVAIAEDALFPDVRSWIPDSWKTQRIISLETKPGRVE
jgi:hypothetical protein